MRDVQATGEPSLTQRPARSRGPVVVLFITALFVIAADLATKTWIVKDYGQGQITHVIPHVLDIEQSRNAGAAFGIATGATVVFSIVAVLVAVVIVREARRLDSFLWAASLGLLLGGALGNLGDRLFRSPGVFRGQVVDWIYLHHWPVFNLADSAITVGGILAVLLATQGRRLDGSREQR